MASCVETAIAEASREHWARLYAILISQFKDFELAEDALQEAFVTALSHWSANSIPTNRAGWLLQVAKNKAIDTIRKNQNYHEKVSNLGEDETNDQNIESLASDLNVEQFPDERLKLIFTCCHPALSEQAQVALTLRTVGGLTTPQIARAFLLPDTTLAQRIVRAKRKIKSAKIPFKVPDKKDLQARLHTVLNVIYLIFNEGYYCSSGDKLLESQLTDEAIYLCKILSVLIDEPEVSGLLALMLFHDARKNARVSQNNEYLGLEEQDRKLWDQEKITFADTLLKNALKQGQLGIYQIQAAISGIHAKAPSFKQTHWQEILLLYQRLYHLKPCAVVKLNSLVALSYVHGADLALHKLMALNHDKKLDNYQPFYATKADFCRRLKKFDEAKGCYEKAIKLSANEVERCYLEKRLKQLNIQQ
ncbi:RNA polymerase sigma factor [Agarilytica rhodophyticola]|uniref:RNA polymerase sigma factor n=1 Tax=Agarilytica rhodophyticola TaxID=1737490 RepID=UPI000B344AC6|nr:RNA polymerase sigma factor [Agarilytica rhodophyticola]